jgi:hypothetical protein
LDITLRRLARSNKTKQASRPMIVTAPTMSDHVGETKSAMSKLLCGACPTGGLPIKYKPRGSLVQGDSPAPPNVRHQAHEQPKAQYRDKAAQIVDVHHDS